MCIAVPMKITTVSKDKTTAIAELRGNECKIDVSLISPAVGDFVIVHAGCGLEIMHKDAAQEILELFEEIAE